MVARPIPVLARLISVLALCGACDAGGVEEQFERDVVPVLEQRCVSGACHGVYSGQQGPKEGFFVDVDADGLVRDVGAARRAALSRVTTRTPMLSSLVRAPLPAWAGGVTHVGGASFRGPDDPAVRAIVHWIEAEPLDSGGEDEELDDLQELFSDTVLPVLAERCGRGGCHSAADNATTAFSATPDRQTGRFAARDIRARYATARKHLDLWSDDPMRSRLIRKALGPSEGGMQHRGGDGTFFPELEPGKAHQVPGVRAMLTWARAERAALGVAEKPSVAGLLFVRGPSAERAPFRIEAEPVGSDLYQSAWPYDAASLRNLTASLHAGKPASVRDPALSHDGQRVTFAMRLQGEVHYSLWELTLDSGKAHRWATDLPGSYVQPQYLPDGSGVVAAWDGHGEAGADGPGIAPELVAVDRDGHVRRLTYTPAPEVSPSFLAAGKTRGELLFSTRRSSGEQTESVLFRFPLCHDPDKHGEPEYHVHFGSTIRPLAPLVARDLADGRQVFTALTQAGVRDDRGALGLLDRSMGPALRDGERSSLGGQRQPVSWLSTEHRFRDPAPLPDGRILVAANGGDGSGHDGLYLLTLRDGVLVTTLESMTLIAREPGESLRSPVPIFTRPPEEDPHTAHADPNAGTGFLALRDVAVLEALYGRTAPTGQRTVQHAIRAIRIVQWGGIASDDIEYAAVGGTNFGSARRPPRTWLADVPLPADRSAWLEIPARTPVQLQWLDERGMLIGNQLDRWYYAEGAETVPGGTNAATYAHACTGCHGSLSGEPEDAAALEPDVLSSASVTLSTHDARDRRRPLQPIKVAAGARAIDFVHDLAEDLAATCASAGCHAGANPAGGISLEATPDSGEFSPAYLSLTTRAVDMVSLRARRSVLVERLLGEELEAEAAVQGRCPPDGVAPELLQKLVRWIELGAFYDVTRGPAHEE